LVAQLVAPTFSVSPANDADLAGKDEVARKAWSAASAAPHSPALDDDALDVRRRARRRAGDRRPFRDLDQAELELQPAAEALRDPSGRRRLVDDASRPPRCRGSHRRLPLKTKPPRTGPDPGTS
jgi:hypothetical protein